ncbi:MAG TPA: exonuclease domain-containing protein [Steroidobacteraceae bacterium]|nr:exonuclease domain-containing protein [Steroidobacteraceae bacterium]
MAAPEPDDAALSSRGALSLPGFEVDAERAQAARLERDEAEQRARLLEGPLAFVDVETTGGDVRYSRITEIAIVAARGETFEEEWSTLVNPGCPIPPHITALTGIDDAMVEDAPTFDDIAVEVARRLEGRLFVAHNVSFDRSFVRTELDRAGRSFNPRSLCTVRLSRRLHPGERSHALDSVIHRLGITVARRHRALDDARVLWELWQRMARERNRAELGELVADLAGLTTLPPQLPPDLADEIPESPGVYRFYGAQRALLYVGKSRSLRTRVLAHFRNGHRNHTDLRLKMQVRDIEWRETPGELGAELAEVHCVRESQPVYNKRLKHSREIFTLRLDEREGGGVHARVEQLDPHEREPLGAAYGLYRSHAEAARAVKKLLREHSLCAVALGLEQSEGSCVAFALDRCRGACIGAESARLHAARVRMALARDQLPAWPFSGAVGIRERSGRAMEVHVVRNWRYVGTACSDEQLAEVLEGAERAAFDIDLYRILVRHLNGRRHRGAVFTLGDDYYTSAEKREKGTVPFSDDG